MWITLAQCEGDRGLPLSVQDSQEGRRLYLFVRQRRQNRDSTRLSTVLRRHQAELWISTRQYNPARQEGEVYLMLVAAFSERFTSTSSLCATKGTYPGGPRHALCRHLRRCALRRAGRGRLGLGIRQYFRVRGRTRQGTALTQPCRVFAPISVYPSFATALIPNDVK